MKNTTLIFGILLIAAGSIRAQVGPVNQQPKAALTKIEASPASGFTYPYFLYVPPELRNTKAVQTILVLPNNTGRNDDDLKVHEDYVTRRTGQYTQTADKLATVVLIPVFPRPKTDWKIYTHALDRDSLLTDKKEYNRFDRQLVAMIDDARKRLKADDMKTDKRVFIMGFSASGMFANRFTFLHPDRVKAAAIGSPGGWPIAPIGEYKNKSLRYPIGSGDLKTVAGRSLDRKALQKVAFFMFLGDKDDNDSVTFGDGYDTEDKDLVFELFGKTPVERWEISRKFYVENKLKAEFKLYPGVKHTVTEQMIADVAAFFRANK